MKQFRHIHDNELAGKVSSGDREAYEELFLRYAPGIYRFSLSSLKDKALAEDLTQDVFLKIWEKHSTLSQTGNIRAFIFKVAVNAIYDFIRRKNIAKAFDDFTRLNNSPSENSAWDSLIYGEMRLKLDMLISQLPEQQRHIFMLNRLEGLSNEEIASELNLSKRTVENHLYRSILFLKEHFKAYTLPELLFFILFIA